MIKLELTDEEARLVGKLAKRHADLVGGLKGKPKSMTIAEAFAEFGQANGIVAAVEAKLGLEIEAGDSSQADEGGE